LDQKEANFQVFLKIQNHRPLVLGPARLMPKKQIKEKKLIKRWYYYYVALGFS
jgi:hypothetical protein